MRARGLTTQAKGFKMSVHINQQRIMVVMARDLAFLKLPREIAFLIVNFLPWFEEFCDDVYDVENKPCPYVEDWRDYGDY